MAVIRLKRLYPDTICLTLGIILRLAVRNRASPPAPTRNRRHNQDTADGLPLALSYDDDPVKGGAGNDGSQFETVMNHTRESILDNTMGDGIGGDGVTDHNPEEDRISTKGHTPSVDVSNDTDWDNNLTVYWQQRKHGGAHDQDYLGSLVVHRNKAEVDATLTDPDMHCGAVDMRDVAGDPMGNDPDACSSNPWLNSGQVALSRRPSEEREQPGIPDIVISLAHESGAHWRWS